MSQIPGEGLQYRGGRFGKSRGAFESAYNELMHCKNVIDGNGEDAPEAKEAIGHFVQLFGGNKTMRDYLLDLLNRQKAEE